MPRQYHPLSRIPDINLADPPAEKIPLGSKTAVIITDADSRDGNLNQMINRFALAFSGPLERVNLNEVPMKGGCTGCVQCGYDNQCMYGDGFSEFYAATLLPADIIVFASVLRGRNMSSTFKTFFDRRFYLNHRPEMQGKQVIFMVSGPVSQLSYMQDFFQGAIEWQDGNLTGVVTDESGDADLINQHIQFLAQTAVAFSKTGYVSPGSFLGAGGTKIFRDAVRGKLRHIFQADYRLYKEKRMFKLSYPSNRARLFVLMMKWLTKLPRFRQVFYRKARTEHSKPHRRIVERC